MPSLYLLLQLLTYVMFDRLGKQKFWVTIIISLARPGKMLSILFVFPLSTEMNPAEIKCGKTGDDYGLAML